MNIRPVFAALGTAFALGIAVTGASSAADMRLRKSPPPLAMPPSYAWTGAYLGAHIGGAWASEDFSGGFSTDPSGVMGGFQIGYDQQFSSNWLVGGQFDMSFTGASGSAGAVLPPATTMSVTSDHNWYATLTSRVGYVNDSWLYFVRGGLAWMNADYSLAATGLIAGAGSTNESRAGWTIGAGVEWMFMPLWSAKLEYNFMDFGTNTISVAGIAPFNSVLADTQVHLLKFGVNYRFRPGPL